MNKLLLILFGFFIYISMAEAKDKIKIDGTSDKITLTGKITDKKTGEALAGVNIYIPDLKTGAISDLEGRYKIENLPSSKVLIQLSLTGYKLVVEKIDLDSIQTKDFMLEESIHELHEVVVTGLTKSAEKNRTPVPVVTIPTIQLLQNASSNIIDAISKSPGISQVTTGSGISKPVIRGLSYNRVLIVNDGIRLEGQQWGDEHGVELDEYAVSKVEILKGPASLAYGSDAMAGVINFISAPTVPEGKVTGNILTNYQTNNGLIGYTADFAGNQHGFIWDLRYSNKSAHAYHNKFDGYVFNSAFKESAFHGIIGINKSWGYTHLNLSAYHLMPGIVEGFRDSVTGKFVKPVVVMDSIEAFKIATSDELMSYVPLTPYQKVYHYKAVLNNSFIIGDGSLKVTLGWQQNQRLEYADILNENKYGLYFLLNTFNYDLRYLLPEKNNLNILFGINGMKQNARNRGTEYLIPEYDLFDAGVFVIIKKSFDKLDVSGGIRLDSRNENAEELFLDKNGKKTAALEADGSQKFKAFNSTFTGVSGSIGATYQFTEHIFSKINLSRGFRAPNISELAANGVHEGTIRYETGNPNLNAEHSLQLDLAFGLNLEHVSAEIDLFSNNISNYIFTQKLQSAYGGDSLTEAYNTFRFISGDAQLTGGEITFDIHPHPLDWLHFENSISIVQAVQKDQPDSTKYLPFTPATKFTSELKATSKKLGKNLANAYIKFGIEHYFKQDHFYAAWNTETETPAYTLINIGIGTDFIYKGQVLFSLYINGENLADRSYQSHLSRLKYATVNNATGRTGIYNMGRNISLKLQVPIHFNKNRK